jgi:hypothetical protein
MIFDIDSLDKYNHIKEKDKVQPKSILSKSYATSRISSRQASVSIDPAENVNYPHDQRPSFRLPKRMTSCRSTIFQTPTLCCIGMTRADDWDDQESLSNSSHDEDKRKSASWISRGYNTAAFFGEKG